MRIAALGSVALGAWLTSGCFGAPLFRGSSENFTGLEFKNVDSYEERDLCDVIEWQLTSEATPWPEWIETETTPAPPRSVEKGVTVTFVNHATTLIQLAGVNVLTDPVWSDTVGPLEGVGPRRHKAPGVRFEELPPIHVVLLSHNHYDHTDLPTLQRLRARFDPVFVAGLGTRALLARAGIERGVDLDWWQETRIGEIAVTFTPAKHWSGRGIEDQNGNLWGSFVVEGGGRRVYFAGDTGWGSHFAAIRERKGRPDVALLPIGAYSPRWFMEPQHIDPEEAVRAHVALGARRSLAIHWGTFALSDEGPDDPPRALAAARGAAGLAESDFVALENGRRLVDD
jgi:L-ascorbate metabolism protein UlaG (beta-lactamase superfamily)